MTLEKPRRRFGRLSLSRRSMVLALAGVALTAVTLAAPAGTAPTAVKPVIGKPVSVPAKPVAGKRFVVTFKVTRSDTGAPLTRGTMICAPTVFGRMISHAESFRRGTARLAFVVPASAVGKLLKVKVTIKAETQSATKVAIFRVQGAPVLSIADASAAEGNADSTVLSFPVRLSAPAATIVSVAYATADGTATAPSDYVAASGTLTFRPGEMLKTIPVSVAGDLEIEQDETFTIALSSAENATIAVGTATGTIRNDDTAVPVASGNYRGATQEGNYIFFTVTTSRMLTALRLNALPCMCDPGGRLDWAPDFGDAAMLIRADGTFAVEESWSGSEASGDIEWTYTYIRITGAFNTATSATGSILIKLELNYEGTHFRCSSGDVKWSAARES